MILDGEGGRDGMEWNGIGVSYPGTYGGRQLNERVAVVVVVVEVVVVCCGNVWQFVT